jgi:hypothetical protein
VFHIATGKCDGETARFLLSGSAKAHARKHGKHFVKRQIFGVKNQTAPVHVTQL